MQDNTGHFWVIWQDMHKKPKKQDIAGLIGEKYKNCRTLQDIFYVCVCVPGTRYACEGCMLVSGGV